MTNDWTGADADPGGIAELVVHRKWGQAIDVLRTRLSEGHVPSVEGRLQLADLMVNAGRAAEATPVLLDLAAELARDRFIARAVAILKRIERIEPGRVDVAERLAELALAQTRLADSIGGSGSAVATFDVEEEGGLAAEASRDAGTPEAAEPSVPLTEDDGARRADPSLDAAKGAGGEAGGVGERLRGVLRRFLRLGSGEAGRDSAEDVAPEEIGWVPSGAVDATGEAAAESGTAEVKPVEAGAEAPASEVTPLEIDAADEGPPFAAVTDPLEAEVTVNVPGAADAAAEMGTRPPPTAEAERIEVEPLLDAALEEQILDLVEHVLRRPAPQRPALCPEGSLSTRLLAVPLFLGLSSEELTAVVSSLTLRRFEPGDVLVTEGERGRSLFIISSGRARVFVRTRDGHSVEVGRLGEGDFFGEMAALSGARRGATVTAAAACEVLELDKSALDAIALAQPRVRETLEATYLRRASNADVAAVRQADLADGAIPERAVGILEARFGEGRWDPRMRLRLADVLLKAGQYEEAVPVLVSLVDDLARQGHLARAIALVKKIERIQNRHVEELPLAPLVKEPRGAATFTAPPRGPVVSPNHFETWLLRLAREALGQVRSAPAGGAVPPNGYGPGLRASPLFEGFSDDELLALVAGLRSVSCQPGDVIVTEGEPGEGLFVVATGAVKVMVRDRGGRSVPVSRLDEGAFFGEIAALSGRPRSATVVAASACELLELDRKTLDDISSRHSRVRELLERAYVERAADPLAERIRTE